MKHLNAYETALRGFTTRLGATLRNVGRFLERPLIRSKPATNIQRGGNSATRLRPQDEQRKRARLMKRDLFQLLGRHPDSRRMMRNLTRVERALKAGGVPGLEALPVRVLTRALDELERVVWDWSPEGLAELRSRIAVLLKTLPPDSAAEAAASSQPLDDLSEFGGTHRVDISEVGHDTYEEMERSWIGQIPTPTASAPAAPVTPLIRLDV